MKTVATQKEGSGRRVRPTLTMDCDMSLVQSIGDKRSVLVYIQGFSVLNNRKIKSFEKIEITSGVNMYYD